VIKWPVKLYVLFTFLTFFSKSKNMTFYVFLSCCTRFLEHWSRKAQCRAMIVLGGDGVGNALRICASQSTVDATRMWANAQPDGRPAKHRWRPLLNAPKSG